MRGVEDRSDALFLYVSPESFVPADHPLRPIRKMADKALGFPFRRVRTDVFPHGPSIGATGSAFEVPAAADSLFDPEQPSAGRAAWLQYSVPLVPGLVPGGSDLGSLDVFPKPGEADRDRHRRAVSPADHRTGEGGAAFVEGPLQRGRHPD